MSWFEGVLLTLRLIMDSAFPVQELNVQENVICFVQRLMDVSAEWKLYWSEYSNIMFSSNWVSVTYTAGLGLSKNSDHY